MSTMQTARPQKLMSPADMAENIEMAKEEFVENIAELDDDPAGKIP